MNKMDINLINCMTFELQCNDVEYVYIQIKIDTSKCSVSNELIEVMRCFDTRGRHYCGQRAAQSRDPPPRSAPSKYSAVVIRAPSAQHAV